MSVLTLLIEGLGLVLIIVSIWLHYYAAKIAVKYNHNADRMKELIEGGDRFIELVQAEIESIKESLQAQLEIPLGEHMFHAMFNTLVTLGASEMGKAEKAKQTIALNGFQKIGQSVGRGIKKEIPQIEMMEKFAGGRGGGGGAPGGGMIESIVGDMFGIDLPPGAIGAILGPKQPAPAQEPAKKKSEGWQ